MALLSMNSAYDDYYEVNGLNYKPTAHLPWGTAIGAIGDVLICLGIFRHKIGHGNLILFTKEKDLADFCRNQDFIEEVKAINPTDKVDYDSVIWNTSNCLRTFPDMPLINLAKRAGVDSQNLVRTHIDFDVVENAIPYRWSSPKLPEDSWEEAAGLIKYAKEKRPGQKVILIQPYSFNSSDMDHHWTEWQFGLDYLQKYTPHTYIICGRGWPFSSGDSARFLNLVDGTDHMTDLFALAHMSDGVITTANSLSHYCAITGIKAFVVGNKPLADRTSYFRKFLEVPNIRIMEYSATMMEFVSQVSKWVI